VKKSNAQFIVVMVVVVAWALALLLAQFDGSTMLKVVTPLMTLVFGWLFSAKATEA
jgi:hypothetical protein